MRALPASELRESMQTVSFSLLLQQSLRPFDGERPLPVMNRGRHIHPQCTVCKAEAGMVTEPMRPVFSSTTRMRSEAVAGFIWTKRSKGTPLESRSEEHTSELQSL